MALIVQKYGGTSVGTPERIRKVAERILQTQSEGNQVVAVVSAMSGETNRLIELANEVSKGSKEHGLNAATQEREMDVLLATGEQTTIALASMAIHAMGGKAISMTGAQAGISTDDNHTKARIATIDPKAVHQYLDDGNCVIVAGFQGLGPDGRITTLGRGGSDLSAIAVAAALEADLCQIFTDVDGVYTCDPRVVSDASKIKEISYDEMLEMASSGSKVMQARSVEFAKKFGVRFEVRSSLNNNPGTMVTEETENMEAVVVRGVSLERDQAKVTLGNLSDTPGVASKIFVALADADINIDMIVQNASRGGDGAAGISFTLAAGDLAKAEACITELATSLDEGITVEADGGIAKLSVVGIGMKSHSGVAAKMFAALGEAGVNIDMISTSEIKIAVTLSGDQLDQAAQVVHAAFDLSGQGGGGAV